jgi:hypothetical protein
MIPQHDHAIVTAVSAGFSISRSFIVANVKPGAHVGTPLVAPSARGAPGSRRCNSISASR